MVRLKVGGMILTGIGAFLIAEKVLNTVERSVKHACDARKWNAYYKCWTKGIVGSDPIAPGYSMTTRPDGADYEIVHDPEGKDHSEDNNKAEDKANGEGGDRVVKAVCDCLDALAKKMKKDTSKGSDEPTEASEAQETASESDNIVDIFDKPPEGPESDPMYRDSLENGVEVVAEDDEEDNL